MNVAPRVPGTIDLFENIAKGERCTGIGCHALQRRTEGVDDLLQGDVVQRIGDCEGIALNVEPRARGQQPTRAVVRKYEEWAPQWIEHAGRRRVGILRGKRRSAIE